MAKKRSLDIDALLHKVALVRALKATGIIVYEVMWGNAEDWGGIELDAESLALRTGALKVNAKQIENIFRILIKDLKKIVPYQADGKHYGWIRSLLEHQPLNNPALPILPLPEWISYEEKQYPSGKKYAKYAIIQGKIPVAYQNTTRNRDTIPYLTIPKDTKDISKAEPSAALQAALKKISDDGLNIYSLINQLKKRMKQPKDFCFPEEVLLGVCAAYDRDKGKIDKPWPWFIKVIQIESGLWHANQQIKTNTNKQGDFSASIKTIMKGAK